MSQFTYGYDKASEDHQYLKASQLNLKRMAPPGFVFPAKLSYRNIIKIWNQLNLGSCVGHGGSYALTILAFLANGSIVRFNRMLMYLLSQRESGIQGDRGATISGLIKAANDFGDCTEELWPYTGHYTTKIPNGLLEKAKVTRAIGHKEMTSWDEIMDWIGTATGVVVFGFDVTPEFENLRGPNSIVTPAVLSGRKLGGHCNVLAGYSGDKDENGDFLLDDPNSWDVTWGDDGWCKWKRAAVEKILRDEQGQSSFWGLSDITGFDQNRVDRVVAWSEVM